jgi:hypothetical protein
MSTLSLELPDGRTSLRPGEQIAGMARWDLRQAPESLEVRLFWYTEGKGTRDTGLATAMEIQNPGPSGEEPFSFEVPQGPFSFSGRLVSLCWAVELVSERPDQAERLDLVVSPTGEEIRLGTAEADNWSWTLGAKS